MTPHSITRPFSIWTPARSGAALAGLGVLAAAVIAGCTPTGPPPAAEKKAPEVVVTNPVTSTVTDYDEFTGRLDALKTVDIRARVSGFVTEAPFKEGDRVHEGDLLFQIDARPYQASFNQAEANLHQAEAEANLQEKNANRARIMMRDQSISREEYDQVMATLEKARATVGSQRAARDLAKLYLDYTHVVAPVTGRVSRRNVDPGNLVKADDTLLTTVVSDSPLYAYFDVDERTYLDLVKNAQTHAADSLAADLKFPVEMQLANETKFSRSGVVDFIDNRVSATTGTIRMRGVFDNKDGALKPGLFARIRLPISSAYQAIVVSDEAVQSDQGRKFVYVVNDKNEVVYRPVTLGQEAKGMRVIRNGLTTGDRVIVSGQQRVRPGVQVTIKLPKPAGDKQAAATEPHPAAAH